MSLNSNDDLGAMSAQQSPASAEFGIHVDGDALVLPSGCTLPQACILTNQPVSESDMVLANLPWTPNSLAIYGLLGGLFFLMAGLAGRELCLITYGINRTTRIKKTAWTVVKILASVALLAGTVGLAIIPWDNWIITPMIWITFGLFLVSVVVIYVDNQPLRVVDFKEGMFWVKGFSKEFLDELEL